MRPVAEFVEKPDAARAKAFVASGDYFWNSGMFLLPAQGYLDELGRQDPEMLAACRKAFEAAASDLDFVRLDKAAFEACRADSIDYAVMEKTSRAAVVPLSAGWSDVGSFAALQDALPPDASGNVTRGDVFVEDAKNCLLYLDRPPGRRRGPRRARRDRDQGRGHGRARRAASRTSRSSSTG